MSKNTFNEDIDLFLSELERSVGIVLDTNVAEAVKDEMVIQIEENVYNAYTPKFDNRRKENGGLSDVNNMRHNVIGGNVLIVKNETPRQDLWGGSGNYEELSTVVEEGLPQYYMPFPRPFHSKVEESIIQDSTKVDVAMINGLIGFGFNAKLKK